MSLKALAAISAVLGIPFESFHPKFELKKWNPWIEEICAMVASKGDVLSHEELIRFLKVLEERVRSMYSEGPLLISYIQQLCEREGNTSTKN